ncbi:cadherin-related family member 5 isoform X3 [Myotis myotis]|uniref:cadherin-related family member 5 isoform X3 n=1 Tax=Myotis myotis TaxID=51298 RepID=UPI001749D8C1|nr:cadherin-related family member 5 isoform X3 [Myotis myotis]
MGAWALLLALLLALAQAQGCSVNQTLFQIEENTVLSGPLVDIQVPQGQQVTLGPLSTPHAFRIQGNQLFLNVTPDYEDRTMLLADLECRRGDTVVSQLKVFVTVLDVNDNPPVFPFKVKTKKVPEDTKVNTIVIPQEELAATDLDKSDILFYTLQEVTPGAGSVFSLVGTNFPALRLAQPLDFDRSQNMTLRLRVRDTQDESAVPSHSATATLVLEVQPADRRPPWFLPCLYSDLLICVQAQYQGAIPTGHKLPAPLTLRPGPIYAVDGDRGINQRIIYSILRGNEDGTFVINADSGNLTMARSVPSPKTFLLLVKGEQEDRARYSVTQVTIEARDAAGSLPRFPQSLYRGAVALGSGVGVAVKDAADPSQPLRIQAQDPEFPDLNSAITYEITNNSDFRMDGEAVLTAAPLGQAGVFYAEVQAKNTVTAGTATTVAEIQVSEQEPPPTGTTLKPSALSTTPGGPSSVGTSTSPSSATSSGGSQQTSKPGSTGAGGTGDGGHAEDQRFSAVEMGVLGGVLGSLLLLALLALVILLHKHYGPWFQCCSSKALEAQPYGFDNKAFLPDDREPSWAPAPSPVPEGTPAEVPPEPPVPPPPTPPLPAPPASPSPSRAPESPAAARDEGGPAGVRSILTKERRPEGGYKAVWFGENIGAEADVVVLNAPVSDADGAGDSGSEGGDGSDDEGADAGPGWGPRADAPGTDSTYI